MEKFVTYLFNPSREQFLLTSETGEGVMHNCWENTCMVYNPDYVVMSHDDYTAHYDQWELDKICVISKLVGRPTSNYLQKCWGLFFATGEQKYLDIAHETRYNIRATEALRQEATTLFAQANALCNSGKFAAMFANYNRDVSNVLSEFAELKRVPTPSLPIRQQALVDKNKKVREAVAQLGKTSETIAKTVK